MGSFTQWQKIFIEVNEDKLRTAANTKAGRPIEHEIDFVKVEQMKADGKTNKEIYTELGISKSLFYLKMREYKNNIGQWVIYTPFTDGRAEPPAEGLFFALKCVFYQ